LPGTLERRTPTLEHIEITAGIRSGKPHIIGTRISVADIVLMHRRMGRALEEIAGTYELSLAAVYSAMAYYYDHKAEIDQSLDEEEGVGEAFRKNNPSLLREKLKAISRD
jgi:uncharacterized protein (DUF433 family)